MIQDSDIHYFRDYCSSNTTTSKVQTQKTIIKKFCINQLRPKKAKPANGKVPAPPRSKFTEFGKISHIDKKKAVS